MACCDFPDVERGCDGAFTVDASRITFGRGCLAEVGDEPARWAFGGSRCSPMPVWRPCPSSLRRATRWPRPESTSSSTPTCTSSQPTRRSRRRRASRRRSDPDGYVSLGGGSVIDTCKAANLYATHPADFLAYVNAPIGEGKPVPGPLKPHIACPTTAGTGSEVTGIAIFDLLSLTAKTGIARPHCGPPKRSSTPTAPRACPPRSSPQRAWTCFRTPGVLHRAPLRPPARSHAPSLRPMSQGANPWSDLGCREALRVLGRNSWSGGARTRPTARPASR